MGRGAEGGGKVSTGLQRSPALFCQHPETREPSLTGSAATSPCTPHSILPGHAQYHPCAYPWTHRAPQPSQSSPAHWGSSSPGSQTFLFTHFHLFIPFQTYVRATQVTPPGDCDTLNSFWSCFISSSQQKMWVLLPECSGQDTLLCWLCWVS